MSPKVLVSIVTHNSERFLRRCLESLKGQTFQDVQVCLWDNASDDDSLAIGAEFADLFQNIRASTRNAGFCEAHNRVIGATASEYVLVLNPDVVLEKDFTARLVDAMDHDCGAGSATGRLWRWPQEPLSGNGSLSDPRQAGPSSILTPEKRTLDTTGIYFTPAQRHFDRGAGELDAGRYERREYVFGASGAAAFYRRAMLDAVRAGDQYFDEDFFAYREDADLAWRAQWLGWKCLYVPEATGYHVRHVLPERRAYLPADVNMHSFKNRFLMRIKNMDPGTYARFFLPITFRDLAALAYVFAREPSSLRAFPLLVRALPRAWSVRKALKRHRRVSAAEIRSWFAYKPVALPVQRTTRS